MDYKQKYEDALNRAKSYKGLIAEMGIVFPELKESEDERIRKNMREFLLDAPSQDIVNHHLDLEETLAWLEKQGEKIDTIENFDTEFEKQVSCLIASVINREHEYNQGYVKWTANALLEYAKHELEKQGEQKPTNEVESEFKAGDFIADGIRTLLVLANKEERNLGETYSTYCEGLVLTVHGDVLVDGKDFSGFRLATDIERANFVHDLKVGTRIHYRAAELSEYDEPMLDTIISNYEYMSEEWLRKDRKELGAPSECARRYIEEDIAWLKSIKDRVRPKQEWSEEDERLFQIVIDILDKQNHLRNISHTDLIACVRKLKSLKPQPHWKPSDEQMDYLKKVYESYYFCDGERSALESLYNDLKKL